MAKPFNENAAIRGALRRAFARSPIVREIMDESKRYVPRYKKDGTRAKRDGVERQCQVCGGWFMTKFITVDHIDPVVSTDEGFVDWNTFIDRLWHCGREKLQRICDDDHSRKTASERFDRTFKEELKTVMDIESMNVTAEEAKAFLKKFTPKRLLKYPYPDHFLERVARLRSNFVNCKKS
jgi:hypothetical protein